MTIEQFVLILRARYRIVLVLLITVVAFGAAACVFLPRQYAATTTLIIDAKSDPMVGMMLPTMGIPTYNIATQTEIITSPRVSQSVVKILKLDTNQAIKNDWLKATDGKGQFDVWLGSLLRRKLIVVPSRESNVIAINYVSNDPGFSAAVANAFAHAYIGANIELKVEPAKQYAVWFEQQTKTLRDRLDQSQARLSAYQQEKGIVATGERLDSENANLLGLQNQLAAAETQGAEVRSKQKSGGGDTLGEVMQNPLILQLKGDIARQEAKLDEVAVNLGQNHPQYLRMESEIVSLKKKLAAETRQIAASIGTSNRVSKEMVVQMKIAVEARKQHILELNKTHDEISALQRDVDGAKKAYDAVSQRYTQSNLESQATQTNISVLTPATEPLEPSSPNVLKIIFSSLLIGSFVGVGAALFLELMNRRIRSISDITDNIGIPVLAVLLTADKEINKRWYNFRFN